MSTDLAVPEMVEGELAQVPANLFGTSDPVAVVEQSSKIASALADVITKKNLSKRIGQKDHVLVEGWCLLGSMLGVFPVVQWTRKLEDGWEARVEARTLGGQVVGAAEAECLRSESLWKNRDDYALRSMAQTRAVSKALRGPLGFIVQLAGLNPTPAEEMPNVEPQATPQDDEARKTAIATVSSSLKHAKEHGSLPPGHDNWDEYLKWHIEGRYKLPGAKDWRKKLSVEQMNELAAYMLEQDIPL